MAQPESPPAFQKAGALNGSDVAATYWAEMSEEGMLQQRSDKRNSLMFFQHHTGEIRWTQYKSPDRWHGGISDQVVATDAKSGTPLYVIVNRPSSNRFKVHVFCKCLHFVSNVFRSLIAQTSAQTTF